MVLRIRISRRITEQNISCLAMFRDQTYRLTNWAFKLRPLHESPLHRSQRSAFFSSAGFLLSRLAPGLSLSVSKTGAVNVFVAIIEGFSSILIRLAFMYSCRGSPESSAIMNSVYETLGYCSWKTRASSLM